MLGLEQFPTQPKKTIMSFPGDDHVAEIVELVIPVNGARTYVLVSPDNQPLNTMVVKRGCVTHITNVQPEFKHPYFVNHIKHFVEQFGLVVIGDGQNIGLTKLGPVWTDPTKPGKEEHGFRDGSHITHQEGNDVVRLYFLRNRANKPVAYLATMANGRVRNTIGPKNDQLLRLVNQRFDRFLDRTE
jgi:hypothetical protein